ncbi:MAG: LCCL domain-containing protein [Spirochaetes bacterium]|jgi:hypothetical protein|nr:LCCL domain-containing protein [Spirochaetota bacterium]
MKFRIIILCLIVAAFSFGCKKAVSVKCDDKIKDASSNAAIGSSFSIACPSGCGNGSVWGTDTYTTDSSLCAAAVHAGAIDAAKGGTAVVTVTKSLPSYKGSARNGVKTRDWGTSWGDSAFKVSK